MSRSKFVLLTLILIAVPGVPIVIWFGGGLMHGQSPSEQYPPAPFAPVPKEFPRIIAVSEAPSRTNEAEWKAYLEHCQGISEYMTTSGAAARCTEQEREAISSDRKREFARSREKANQVLKESPNSVPALIALSGAEAFGDGNLSRGLYLIQLARRICESRGTTNSSDTDAREWYLRAMDREFEILGQLDQRQEQLAVVNRIESIYEPLPTLKIWPLIKLRRYDEAAETIEQAHASGQFKKTVLNSRCAIAWEMQRRDAAFQAGAEMANAFSDSPSLWSNYGQTALGVFRFDEAEKAYLKSASLGRPDFIGTAYNKLCTLYLQQGRVAEAIDAIKKANRQRAVREPHTLQQDQASTDLSKTMLMIVLGRGDDAIRHGRSAYDSPDRGGFTSDNTTVLQLSCALGYAASMRTRVEELYEESSSLAIQPLEYEAWLLERKIRKMTDSRMLCNTIRPHLSGGPDVGMGTPSWLRLSVAQFFPPGVAAEAIRQVRIEETHPLAIPYLDAVDAETHLRLGNYTAAYALARKALDGLPSQGEKLLCGRVALVAAQAAFHNGDFPSAMPLFERALQDFPAAFRLLGVALPVRIEHDGQASSQQMAVAISHSRRFRRHNQGFVLSLKYNERMIDCKIAGPNGSQILANQFELADFGSVEVAKCTAAIQERLFSPAIDLTQSDMTSLDGSPIAARSREMIDHLLKPQMR